MIKTENLTYIYQQGMPFERRALNNVSIEIQDGEFAALIGHTGSGKSTLIQHFNALIRPTSGKIFIDGTDITDPKTDLKLIRRNVGLVFQYPEHQLFEETLYKDIAFGPTNMGMSEREIKECVYSALDMVGLSRDLLDKSPFELSGGQKRRAAIAGVLAMKPRVLILDEPTAGLDPAGRNEIMSSIKHLHDCSDDMTVIFVSHSMEEVAKIADTVIVMNDGEVLMHDSMENVFSRARELTAIGLNVPQITLLMMKLREHNIDVPENVYRVSNAADILTELIGRKNNA